MARFRGKYLDLLDRPALMSIAKEAKEAKLLDIDYISDYSKDKLLGKLQPTEEELHDLGAYTTNVAEVVWEKACASGNAVGLLRFWEPGMLSRGLLMQLARLARDAELCDFECAIPDMKNNEIVETLSPVVGSLAGLVAEDEYLGDSIYAETWWGMRFSGGDLGGVIDLWERYLDPSSPVAFEEDARAKAAALIEKPKVGVVRGLWAGSDDVLAHGGIRRIEAALFEGNGPPRIIGDVDKSIEDSVQASWDHVRIPENSASYGISEDKLLNKEVHIQFVEIMESIEGPSAGIPFVVSIVSAVLGCPIRPRLAATGEISMRGTVSAVGGISQKLAAARRAGCEIVIMPKDNEEDLDEVPEEVRDALDIRLVDTPQEAVKIALDLE